MKSIIERAPRSVGCTMRTIDKDEAFSRRGPISRGWVESQKRSINQNQAKEIGKSIPLLKNEVRT